MNNEEKILTMLETMNNRLEKLEQGQAKLEQGQVDLNDSLQIVRTSQLRVELEQFPKIQAALDGAVGGNEKNKEQDGRISTLENRTENQGNRILALEYAFQAK